MSAGATAPPPNPNAAAFAEIRAAVEARDYELAGQLSERALTAASARIGAIPNTTTAATAGITGLHSQGSA